MSAKNLAVSRVLEVEPVRSMRNGSFMRGSLLVMALCLGALSVGCDLPWEEEDVVSTEDLGVDTGSPWPACCLPDNVCEHTTLEKCEFQGGVIQPEGVMCEDNPCPGNAEEGACCIGNICMEMEEGKCQINGGTWYGVGSDCEDHPCPVLDLEGACCLQNGACVEMSQPDCQESTGIWGGTGTSCGVLFCPTYL